MKNVFIIQSLAAGGGGGDSTPIGTIVAYIGPSGSLPAGYLLCNGSLIPEEYKTLRSYFTTGYTPDLTTGIFLQGSKTINKFNEAGLPALPNGTTSKAGSHTHSGIVGYTAGDAAFGGGFQAVAGHQNIGWGGSHSHSITWQKADKIYGNAKTVQPKSYTVYYIVKAI